MRLYSMHKREFGLVFVAFFSCFIMAIFIGLAGKWTTLITAFLLVYRDFFILDDLS